MTPQRARFLLWTATVLLVLAVSYRSITALLPFAIGAVIAYSLTPLVDRMLFLIPLRQPNHESWRRGIAVLVIYLAFFGFVTAVGFALVPVAVDQIIHFVQELPRFVEAAREQSMGVLAEYQNRMPPEVQQRINALAEEGAATVTALLGRGVQRTVATLSSTLGFVFGFAVVPFWMFYVMRDRHAIAPNIVGAAPAEVREDVRMLLRLSDTLLSRYIRAQLILGLVVGASVGLAMAVLGVELSLGLGVWAGVTELIPIIGPWLGAVPGIVIVAATAPDLLPWVVLIYFAVQQVENNFLVPRIQGKALDLHPGVVILVLVIGGASLGFLGLVIAVPGTAMAREWFWYVDRRLRGQTPEEAFAVSHLNGGHGGAPPAAAPVEARRA